MLGHVLDDALGDPAELVGALARQVVQHERVGLAVDLRAGGRDDELEEAPRVYDPRVVVEGLEEAIAEGDERAADLVREVEHVGPGRDRLAAGRAGHGDADDLVCADEVLDHVLGAEGDHEAGRAELPERAEHAVEDGRAPPVIVPRARRELVAVVEEEDRRQAGGVRGGEEAVQRLRDPLGLDCPLLLDAGRGRPRVLPHDLGGGLEPGFRLRGGGPRALGPHLRLQAGAGLGGAAALRGALFLVRLRRALEAAHVLDRLRQREHSLPHLREERRLAGAEEPVEDRQLQRGGDLAPDLLARVVEEGDDRALERVGDVLGGDGLAGEAQDDPALAVDRLGEIGRRARRCPAVTPTSSRSIPRACWTSADLPTPLGPPTTTR